MNFGQNVSEIADCHICGSLKYPQIAQIPWIWAHIRFLWPKGTTYLEMNFLGGFKEDIWECLVSVLVYMFHSASMETSFLLKNAEWIGILRDKILNRNCVRDETYTKSWAKKIKQKIRHHYRSSNNIPAPIKPSVASFTKTRTIRG